MQTAEGLRAAIVANPLWHGIVGVTVVVATAAVGLSERNLTPGIAGIVLLFVVWHLSLLVWCVPALPVKVTYWVGTAVLLSLLVQHSDTFTVLLYGLYSVAFMTLRWWGLLPIGVLSAVAALSDSADMDVWGLALAVVAPVLISLMMALVMNSILGKLDERDAALAALAQAQGALVRTARRNGVLEERQRLAREIHDTVAQTLVGILRNLDAAEEMLDTGDVRTRTCLLDAGAAGRAGLAELRRSVHSLRSVELDGTGLPQAIHRVTQRWAADHRVPVEFRVTGPQVAIAPASEQALLRAAQESLTNVARHAQAGRAAVTLSYLNGAVTLDVVDDGVGFEPREVRSGFGLLGMRERIEAVGGELHVESSSRAGTTVAVVVPAA